MVHRRLLSTVMIVRKFPNRSFFSLLIYSPHPSATQRILTHFLFVFVCRGWVHPVSVTIHFPPIPLFCFLSVPSVRQGTHWLVFRMVFGSWYVPSSSLPVRTVQTSLLFSCSCIDALLFDDLSNAVLLTHFVCAKKKKNWTGGRLRLSTERKFSFHILSSCLSSWSQVRLKGN